jgi:P-type conjugative transfer protein TrbJ
MIKQGIALPESLYQSITGDLRRVADVYTNTKTLGRDISDLDKRFREQFKDYDAYLKSAGEFDGGNISERQRKWSEQGFDNATSAMRAAGMNVGAFEREDRALNRVVQQSQNATGRLQAIQAGNEIAAQNVQQLQKLRDLTATQITLQSNYLAATTEKETAKAAADEQYFERKPVRSEKVGF